MALKVARAAREIITAGENENPYSLSEHSATRRGNQTDCDEPDFWLDDSRLIPEEELGEAWFFECSACAYQYRLWEAILEQSVDDGESPTTEYGDRVFAALALEEELENGGTDLTQVTAQEREDLRIVKRERQRHETMRAWEHRQEAEQQRAQAARHG